MMPLKPAPDLIRAVGRWELLALAVNGVIGTAIFGLPAGAADLAGAWSPAVALVCAAIVLVIVLCFAEAAALFTATGGPYLYAREAFGDAAGLASGWMTWLARVTAYAGNANLFVAYLAFFIPAAGGGAPRAALLALTTLTLAAVNVRGVRPGALVGGVLAAAKLIPMFAFVLLGLFAMRRDLWVLAGPPSYDGFGAAVLLYVFAFTGFEFAAIPAGEAKSPRSDLPWCMIAALLVAAVLYTGIQTVCVGTLPDLVRSKTAMADASLVFLGPIGATLIAVTALVSILGNLSAMVLVAPRMTYALAADGMLPRSLGAVHSAYRTPHVSIVLYAVLALALALSGTFIGMIRISAIARILPYLLTCGAVPVLRRRHPAEEGRFRLRGGWTLPAAGVALCLWLFSQCSRQDLAAAAVALLAGFALYALSRKACRGVGDRT